MTNVYGHRYYAPKGHKWFFGCLIMPGGEGCKRSKSTQVSNHYISSPPPKEVIKAKAEKTNLGGFLFYIF